MGQLLQQHADTLASDRVLALKPHALGDFRLQLDVRRVGGFGEFMLAQRSEHQRLVHRERLFMELRGLGHLNHHSHGAFVRQHRPHRISPEDRMRFGMLLFCVAFGFSGAENAVEQRHTSVLFRQHFGERFSDELFRGFIHQATKSGVDIAYDMAGSLHRSHRQRRVLGDRQAEARQVGLVRCA